MADIWPSAICRTCLSCSCVVALCLNDKNRNPPSLVYDSFVGIKSNFLYLENSNELFDDSS